MQGVLILNKPGGMTSQTAVNRVKHLLGADKAGHTGTLDPMAKGVLPVLIGRATKAGDFMLTADKHYTAVLKLGLTTDTEDITGNVLSTADCLPTRNRVFQAVSSFVGLQRQTPPMYSALKVGGRKLCDLARQGKEVEREERQIRIFSLGVAVIDEKEGRYALDIHCSKGTYIRTLCADIGKALLCGGVMEALTRTEAAGFLLSDAVSLEALEEMQADERQKLLIPTDKIFSHCPAIILPPFYAALARAGQPVFAHKLSRLPDDLSCTDNCVRLYDRDGFFAVAETRMLPPPVSKNDADKAGGTDLFLAFKPVRQF